MRYANERGSILVITTAFILIFTMLGIAAINTAGMQNEWAEKQRASDEAFWLADGAMQIALHKKKTTGQLISENETFAIGPNDLGNERSYDVYSVADPECPQCVDRWLARSTATVNGQTRSIEAVIAKYDIKNAITSAGTIEGNSEFVEGCEYSDPNLCPAKTGCGGGNSETGDCDPESIFNFESVFNGLSYQDFVDAATAAGQVFDDPANSNDVSPLQGITLVNMVNKSTLAINTNTMPVDAGGEVYPAFLIIDASQAAGNVRVDINGTLAFKGIIWIIGEAEIKGNAVVQGAVFVNGDPAVDTKVLGDSKVLFDPEAVDEAVGTVISVTDFEGTPAIYSWKEV